MPAPASPRLDLRALSLGLGVDLNAAFAGLRALYAAVDARLAARTAELRLPCRRGCDMCCHQSVFLTPLVFLHAWDHLQSHSDEGELRGVVAAGLDLYRAHRALIDRFDRPPPSGAADHFGLACELRFRCPLLAADGACREHPAREMGARLFGGSFQAPGELYAAPWSAPI